MSEDRQRDLGERRLDLELAEALGGAAPPDCTAAVAARLRAAPARRRPSPQLAAAVAAAALLAVAWLWWRAAGTPGPAPVPPVANAPQAAPREHPPRHESAADVAARRSADAMLAAEARLAAQLAAGELPGTAERLPFAALTGWPYTQGLAGAPAAVRALDGRQVLMVGFMLPIDEVRGMRHFLLVESLWSCCYGTPPDVHGLVRVVLPAGRTTEWTAEPLRVRGTLRVGETREDGYVVDVFQLQADEVVPIQ